MADTRGATLDVAQFLQGLKFNRYHVSILILCSMVTFFDGQDFSALAYAMPYLRDDMKLTNDMTGYVSSAAFLGQMIGSLFGSYLGDNFGRRPVILWCTIGSAVFTTMVGFASSAEELIALRFISGLAIGGLLAPVWSLSVESMPKSMRATSVTIIMMGFSFGGASAAPIANWVAPVLGWQGIFWVCGAMTGAFALILIFTLPESTRWMVANGKPASRIVPQLTRYSPGFDASSYTGFVLGDERKVDATDKSKPAVLRLFWFLPRITLAAERSSPVIRALAKWINSARELSKITLAADSTNPVIRAIAKWIKSVRELFIGRLLFITLLIWAAYFFSSFAIYLKSAYGVIFLENLGIMRQNAAWLGMITSITGALGGVLLLAMTERRGPGWIALAPLIGIPFTLLIGFGYVLGGPAFIPVLLISATMVGAGHAAVISITTIYYPSAVRSTGGGWASFMAKFAAVAAPIFGAQFLTGRQGAMDGYVFTAGCLLGIILCVLALAWFARGMRDGDRLAKTTPQPAE